MVMIQFSPMLEGNSQLEDPSADKIQPGTSDNLDEGMRSKYSSVLAEQYPIRKEGDMSCTTSSRGPIGNAAGVA